MKQIKTEHKIKKQQIKGKNSKNGLHVLLAVNVYCRTHYIVLKDRTLSEILENSAFPLACS